MKALQERAREARSEGKTKVAEGLERKAERVRTRLEKEAPPTAEKTRTEPETEMRK